MNTDNKRITPLTGIITTPKRGIDGTTYIPYVDEEGNLSWSNNAGLENPETVNIKGEDYILTPEDVQAIADVAYTEHLAQPIAEITETANTAEAIAKGKATGYVFDTAADLETWLSNPANTESLNLGDNLYIRDTGVPDYWWDGNSKQILETQKVDLTSYVKYTNTATASKTGVVKNTSSVNSGVFVAEKDEQLNANIWQRKGELWLRPASNQDIEDRLNNYNLSAQPAPITIQNLNKAVKEGIVNNNIALTNIEKNAAKNWLGIPLYSPPYVGDSNIHRENYNITYEEGNEYTIVTNPRSLQFDLDIPLASKLVDIVYFDNNSISPNDWSPTTQIDENEQFFTGNNINSYSIVSNETYNFLEKWSVSINLKTPASMGNATAQPSYIKIGDLKAVIYNAYGKPNTSDFKPPYIALEYNNNEYGRFNADNVLLPSGGTNTTGYSGKLTMSYSSSTNEIKVYFRDIEVIGLIVGPGAVPIPLSALTNFSSQIELGLQGNWSKEKGFQITNISAETGSGTDTYGDGNLYLVLKDNSEEIKEFVLENYLSTTETNSYSGFHLEVLNGQYVVISPTGNILYGITKLSLNEESLSDNKYFIKEGHIYTIVLKTKGKYFPQPTLIKTLYSTF